MRKKFYLYDMYDYQWLYLNCGQLPHSKHHPNVDLMLCHRLTCWPTIKPTLSEPLLCDGQVNAASFQVNTKRCPPWFSSWFTVCDAGQTLKQRCFSVCCWLWMAWQIVSSHRAVRWHRVWLESVWDWTVVTRVHCFTIWYVLFSKEWPQVVLVRDIHTFLTLKLPLHLPLQETLIK